MTNLVVLPVPLDNDEVRNLFRPFIERFAWTYRKFPAGAPHRLIAVLLNGDLDDEIAKIFDGIKTEFIQLDSAGCDFAAQQMVSRMCPDCFQLNLTSRCYFHRAGWLNHLVVARETIGPAFYGVSASREGGKLHVCTRAHSFDTNDFNQYPHEITSRDMGVAVECGEWSLTDWFQSIGRKCHLVHWGGVRRPEDIQYHFNGYRAGNQHECLIFDKHTQAYEDASPEEKKRLERMCFEGI